MFHQVLLIIINALIIFIIITKSIHIFQTNSIQFIQRIYRKMTGILGECTHHMIRSPIANTLHAPILLLLLLSYINLLSLLS